MPWILRSLDSKKVKVPNLQKSTPLRDITKKFQKFKTPL